MMHEAGSLGRPSLRELEVLHAMIVTGKTTKAAHALGISQPAVSRTLASLEERTRRVLFTRDGGRMSPTAEALALDAEAQVILEALSRLSAGPGATPRASVVRISASPTLAHRFLAPLIAGFRREEPDVTVQVEIGQSPSVLAAVADGLADIGIVDQPPAHPGIRAEVLRRAVAHVALPQGHQLAGRETLGPQDLAGQDLVALVRRFSLRSLIDRAFIEAGIEQRVVAEVATLAFAVELVREGMGLAVLNPFPVSLRVGEAVVFRRFRPGIPVETAIVSAAAGPTTPSARRLVDFIRRNQPDDGLTTAIRQGF